MILKNHCVSSRCSTSAPERQPRPSITCSLASTVWSTGSQLTFDFLRVDEARGEEIEKQLLLMLVVARIAGRDFARPVERQPHRLQLRAHRVDVGVGPFRGMRVVLHRGVFRRHAERVPAHRMEDVEAARPQIAGDHVAHRVIAHMADMNAPRRIREHLQDVIFRPRIVVAGLENVRVRPCLLPLGFGLAHVVAFRTHERASRRKVRDQDLRRDKS